MVSKGPPSGPASEEIQENRIIEEREGRGNEMRGQHTKTTMATMATGRGSQDLTVIVEGVDELPVWQIGLVAVRVLAVIVRGRDVVVPPADIALLGIVLWNLNNIPHGSRKRESMQSQQKSRKREHERIKVGGERLTRCPFESLEVQWFIKLSYDSLEMNPLV